MARSGHLAVVTLSLAFLCIASILSVSEAALRASVTPVQRRSLVKNTWQNPQVYTQKCPGDGDWYSTKPKNFWSFFKSYCDPSHLPLNQWGNHSKMILDKSGIAGFGSYSAYFTGRFTMKIKLPPGNSSGTVFAFYLSSDGKKYKDHDEVDIEFLGNETGMPITMQTNIFVNGLGQREMRHNLWFDPSEAFHEYFIFWNSAMVLIGVDSIPIRVFMNNEQHGVPYLNKGQALYCSHWDGSGWATQNGRIKIDYDLNAPFVAQVKGFGRSINACRVQSERNVWACKHPGPKPFCWERPEHLYLTDNQKNLLRWVAKDHCIYDYCKDDLRWVRENMTKPLECDMLPY
ncbi:hypothetical protein M758_3G108200 [Ceratodon purpureus]|uniref:Xyloglucan endotransglucosylase/hydrolase n=1 Tax=Ceratodon purpureus TaxID=3225 RepID=A0A8T0IKU1_CERPU|nr:hypothetical protein KC19_3G106300 [Ceratodon purpureus]KAG0583063.1 hypothetical protein KC19_3G106300 [Ceratodon purpureus]KAG0583064.1 hypothetical protein KC19_3G106300 [Ceratodon purpureus]KAG0583065.1 hypothetical protein KC19_3G106300 [Ceratodon purpureus]KAG0583066.1 hypothetical protein KC19_3G106300 [Ceratodon purpureus]